MKSTLKIFLVLLLSASFLSFKSKHEIGKCFISFDAATNLTFSEPERLPEASDKSRTVNTSEGEVEVTRIDGYRILYNNKKNVPFVNLKVELSDPDSYEADQKKLIDNLKYLNAHSSGMETKELIELRSNGYKVFGLSRASIQEGSNLGTFILFPGNGVTVYFYFNNLKPDFRNFESVEDYRKQRNRFIEEYTKYLTKCTDK